MTFSLNKPFRVTLGDNLAVMKTMPDGCMDVALTSPPYVDCRTYGELGFKLKGQAWVDWMVPRIVEACRVTAGLVFVNMAGKVKDFSYGPVVEWLVADLTRLHGIVCGPAPYVFRRVGIPGSGSKHYHRRDWEPVYGFALPKNMPPRWSNNTAMGHPPKWAPGGEMSNRLTDGTRVNQWGGSYPADSVSNAKDVNGKPTPKFRPSHSTPVSARDSYGFTPHDGEPSPTQRANGQRRGKARAGNVRKKDGSRENRDARRLERGNEKGTAASVPVLANPGNVINERYTSQEVEAMLGGGDVIDLIVGGGVMGSKLAHENEAPFPLSLASWFVKSFCPPGGIVFDFFGGSGTCIQAALENGRRAYAIEIREEMVELCYLRGEEALRNVAKRDSQ